MSASGPVRRNADGGRNDWRTPPELFRLLDRDYGFTIDGAASDEWHLLPRYYTEERSAFDQRPADEVIFLNPPYAGLAAWVALADAWSRRGNDVVALVPAATDTRWWYEAQQNALETRLLLGRVRFIDPATGLPGKSNTTGSTIFHFSPRRAKREIFTWDWRAALPVPVAA